jgi:DNA repair ATPase RecN
LAESGGSRSAATGLLARLAQVIVVTHLPQVAAFADTHLMVEKALRRLGDQQRGHPAG